MGRARGVAALLAASALAVAAVACSTRDVPDEELRTEYFRRQEAEQYAQHRHYDLADRRRHAAHRSTIRRTVREWPRERAATQRARMTASAVDIEGRIVAGSETPSGEVREVVISDGEQNYQVASRALRERLSKLLGKSVRLTGNVAGATQYSLIINEATVTLLN